MRDKSVEERERAAEAGRATDSADSGRRAARAPYFPSCGLLLLLAALASAPCEVDELRRQYFFFRTSKAKQVN